jgi:hypothetical protein
MESMDDPQLHELLREWKVEDAPAALEERVMRRRERWWSVLINGSVRVPAPVALAFGLMVVAMGAALVRERPAPAPSAGAPAAVSLADFRPVQDVRVHIIARRYEAQ